MDAQIGNKEPQRSASESRAALCRVLMVAFHFPPIASSAGALRSQAFARYLPENGWEPHVLAPVEAIYDAIDVEAQSSTNAFVHRAWALDARRHFGWHGRYPSLLALPDRWMSWTPAAVKKGLGVIEKFSINAIWSTYPIPTSHLIAGLIARRTGLPWIAEFRDPVLPTGGRIQCVVQRSIEQYVIRHSDHIVFVTEGARRVASARFPEAASRMHVISNGYDEAVEPESEIDTSVDACVEPVVLVHSGHLYPEGRNPLTLLQAVAQLKKTSQVDSHRLSILLRNTQQDDLVAHEIRNLGIGDIVKLAPRLSHKAAMAEQREAHGLILLQGKEFNNQVPAKLFEYLRSERPTLALVHPNGDTAALLHELGASKAANIDSVDEIACALAYFVARLSDETQSATPWQPNPERLKQYSRRRQTGHLAALLDSTISRAATRCSGSISEAAS